MLFISFLWNSVDFIFHASRTWWRAGLAGGRLDKKVGSKIFLSTWKSLEYFSASRNFLWTQTLKLPTASSAALHGYSMCRKRRRFSKKKPRNNNRPHQSRAWEARTASTLFYYSYGLRRSQGLKVDREIIFAWKAEFFPIFHPTLLNKSAGEAFRSLINIPDIVLLYINFHVSQMEKRNESIFNRLKDAREQTLNESLLIIPNEIPRSGL